MHTDLREGKEEGDDGMDGSGLVRGDENVGGRQEAAEEAQEKPHPHIFKGRWGWAGGTFCWPLQC